MGSRPSANPYNLWTVLHITIAHADIVSEVAVNLYTLRTILHSTTADGYMVPRAAVNRYTLYRVTFQSSPPSHACTDPYQLHSQPSSHSFGSTTSALDNIET